MKKLYVSIESDCNNQVTLSYYTDGRLMASHINDARKYSTADYVDIDGFVLDGEGEHLEIEYTDDVFYANSITHSELDAKIVNWTNNGLNVVTNLKYLYMHI